MAREEDAVRGGHVCPMPRVVPLPSIFPSRHRRRVMSGGSRDGHGGVRSSVGVTWRKNRSVAAPVGSSDRVAAFGIAALPFGPAEEGVRKKAASS